MNNYNIDQYLTTNSYPKFFGITIKQNATVGGNLTASSATIRKIHTDDINIIKLTTNDVEINNKLDVYGETTTNTLNVIDCANVNVLHVNDIAHMKSVCVSDVIDTKILNVRQALNTEKLNVLSLNTEKLNSLNIINSCDIRTTNLNVLEKAVIDGSIIIKGDTCMNKLSVNNVTIKGNISIPISETLFHDDAKPTIKSCNNSLIITYNAATKIYQLWYYDGIWSKI